MSVPIILQRRTEQGGDTRWAARATLWPTPPTDWVMEAGLEVCSAGETVGVPLGVVLPAKSQLRSRATDPATRMSTVFTVGFASCFSILVFGLDGTWMLWLGSCQSSMS